MQITADGIHLLGPQPLGTKACIQLTGDLGGGTASIGFVLNGTTTLVPFSWPDDGSPIALTAGGFVAVWAPKDAQIAIELADSTDADVEAHCWPVHFPTTRQF